MRTGHVVNLGGLPDGFPTNLHEPAFWESLGRAVAAFGFLEDALSKAIFAITATTRYSEEEVSKAYEAWLPTLERALVDPLGNLIDMYGKAVRSNADARVENLDELLADLRKAATIRNVICHGSWGPPDSKGATVPFFVNKRKEIFSTPIDASFLDQVRKGTANLACVVVNTVTSMGWQFPGSRGPGEVIWPKN